MQDTDDRLVELEGRLIAHRRLLVKLLTLLDAQARDDLVEWVTERAVLHDGQEDPAAVPTGSAALPLSIAEEFREIGVMAEARRPDPP